MRLIGINGLKGSGKDTTFLTINELLPDLWVERRAFADSLKVMAGKALGYDGTDAELVAQMDELKSFGFVDSCLDSDKGRHLTGRQYLQGFGHHARVVFGDDFWVDQVVPDREMAFLNVWQRVGRAGEPVHAQLPAVGCVTDVRYANEAQRIKKLGGEVWEVVRPGVESDGHLTEQPLPRELVTLTINNNGDLDQLRDVVAAALQADA